MDLGHFQIAMIELFNGWKLLPISPKALSQMFTES